MENFKKYWGFAADEYLGNDDLIRGKYQGIRPAPGYAACPEHTVKQVIWDLLDVEQQIGMHLTSSYDMFPGASVSCWIFSHPESRYFGIAKIQQELFKNHPESYLSIATAKKGRLIPQPKEPTLKHC